MQHLNAKLSLSFLAGYASSCAPHRLIFREIVENRPVNPELKKEGGIKNPDAWIPKTQTELMQKNHAELKKNVKGNLDALRDNLYVKVKPGETLSQLCGALNGKVDYKMEVSYRDTEKLTTKANKKFSDAQTSTLIDDPKIYPGQYVWIKGGKIVVSLLTPDETENEEKAARKAEAERQSIERQANKIMDVLKANPKSLAAVKAAKNKIDGVLYKVGSSHTVKFYSNASNQNAMNMEAVIPWIDRGKSKPDALPPLMNKDAWLGGELERSVLEKIKAL